MKPTHEFMFIISAVSLAVGVAKRGDPAPPLDTCLIATDRLSLSLSLSLSLYLCECVCESQRFSSIRQRWTERSGGLHNNYTLRPTVSTNTHT